MGVVEQNLKEMLQDLSAHQRDKSDLLIGYVEDRLNKTVDTYYKSVLQSAKLLERRNPDKVAKSVIKQK